MDLLVTLLLIVFVNLVAWITPGPNMIAVMSASMIGGRYNGILTGLGLSTGAVFWAGLAVMGVTALFELFPSIVFWLRILGATYLIWLGARALCSALAMDAGALTPRPSHANARRAYLNGLLVSLTNPKAAFFFGSILTAFVPANASAAFLVGVVVLCGLLAVLCHSITATVFSSKLVVRKFNDARRGLTAAFGFVFAGLGLGIAYDTLRRL
ncbi:LysE family translocator [Pelagibius sp. Alg239-R121]|uniref:LysE family translocator n=1 Tax=Pelagibius sp. Alg239-R121 TaxID=2993448 RepID=UPI0024A68E69|nr:LysE family translocator [Pelagibius sp. Alg239-R121]